VPCYKPKYLLIIKTFKDLSRLFPSICSQPLVFT